MVRIKGEANAPIKITEFTDFQCPSCAQGSKYLKKFMEGHPKAVHLEMKYYPLNMHRHAFMSARYAECAGKSNTGPNDRISHLILPEYRLARREVIIKPRIGK